MVTEVKTDEIHVRYIRAEKWWKKPTWELLKEYKSANGEVIAPVGFITDGASVPGFLRGYFSPTGRYFGAAIVHDYVLYHCPQPASKAVWDEANHQMKKELKALEILPWRLWVIINGVRAWAVIRTQILNKLK